MELLHRLPSSSPFAKIVSRLSSRSGVPLVPKGPWDEDIKRELDRLTLEELLGGEIKDQDFGKAVLSGLYNWNDCLEEAHILAQQVDPDIYQVGNPTGSYWHGIMHRREPDYSNSKYWFRRAGQHPVFSQVYSAVENFLKSQAFTSGYAQEWYSSLKAKGGWDPFDFVDRCASAEARGFSPLDRSLLEQVTSLEIQILLEYSFLNALGKREGEGK